MTPKAKKLVLNNQALEEDFFSDVLLQGIVCPLEGYQFAWLISQYLAYPFRRNHDYEVVVKEQGYPVYTYADRAKLIEHYIYTNRQRTHFMLPEIKNVDFLWMSKGNTAWQPELERLPELLKQIPGMVYTFSIQADSLAHRQHLIL